MKAIKLPVDSYSAAHIYIMQHLFKPGRLLILQMLHDQGGPAIRSQRDADCRPPCRPDFYAIEPFTETRAA